MPARGATVGTKVLWVPDNGKAFHTVRLTTDKSAIEEWIVHDNEGDHTRFSSGIQAKRQYWINEIASVPVENVVTFQTVEEFGLPLLGKGKTTHTLKLTFIEK